MSALRWSEWLAAGWLLALVVVAVAAPCLPLPYPPALPDLAHVGEAPSALTRHWLGTDPYGRDVLAELLFGARTAVGIALPAAAGACLLGGLGGGAAGFWGNAGLRLAWPWPLALAGLSWYGLRLPGAGLGLGLGVLALLWAGRWWRARRMRTVPLPLDAVVLGGSALLGTVPRLLLLLAFAAGASLTPAGLLGWLALTTWPDVARPVRAQMLRICRLPFIEAGRAAGLPPARLWLRHALPHALGPAWELLPLVAAGFIGVESTLSFLGVGLPPEVASWGRLLQGLRGMPYAWWLAAYALAILTLTILSLQQASTFIQKRRKSKTF